MIPNDRTHFTTAAGTDPGRKGKNNEDQFSVSAYRTSAADPTPITFAIVADGIGGHSAGEVASEIAVEMISKAVAESDASRPVETMRTAIIQAGRAIVAEAEKDVKKQGMGTTCVCAWVIADRLYCVYVGNSRLYLLRDKNLYQLTNDHTWVQEAVDAGALTSDQARVHPHANVIRRYLGSPLPEEGDTRIRTVRSPQFSAKNQGLRLLPGDRLLLCTDGLNDMIPFEQIHEKMLQHDLQSVVDDLIAAANNQGGKDNITVVVMEMPSMRGVIGFWARLREIRPQLAVAYAGLVVMGLAILTALAAYLYNLLFS